jgi:hypothetical protein
MPPKRVLIFDAGENDDGPYVRNYPANYASSLSSAPEDFDSSSASLSGRLTTYFSADQLPKSIVRQRLLQNG